MQVLVTAGDACGEDFRYTTRTKLANDEVGDVNTVAGFQYPVPGRPSVAPPHVSKQKTDHQVRIRVTTELSVARWGPAGSLFGSWTRCRPIATAIRIVAPITALAMLGLLR